MESAGNNPEKNYAFCFCLSMLKNMAKVIGLIPVDQSLIKWMYQRYLTNTGASQ